MTPIAILDLEIYKDYFLCAVKAPERTYMFEMYDGQPLNVAGIKAILRTYTIVTFNGNHFDLPLLGVAMRDGATCAQVKSFCDKIIVGGLKAWDVERQAGVGAPTCDHIDLIEVAPGFSSLKIYGGRMHSPRMQDLPIAPDESIGPADRALIRDYCANDLAVTEQLFDKLKPQIELRAKLGAQYGLELRSKSDAQIAEAVIGKRVKVLRNSDRIIRPRIPAGTAYRYRAPEWIQFSTATLRTLLATILATDFTVGAGGGITMPEALADCLITLHPSTYRLGIGGLHSTESCAAHHADADTLLLDRDVASYYPNLILRMGLFPSQMGEAFLDVYRAIVTERLAA